MNQPQQSDRAVQEQHALVEDVQATPYFKAFQPRSFPSFGQRHYKPVQYLEEIGIERIGELVQHGLSLGDICKMLDVSSRVMRKWIQGNRTYQDEITAARAFAADEMVHENLNLARHMPDLERAKLIISTQQWTAERFSKDMYGTKQVKVEGSLGFGGGVSFQINIRSPEEAKAKVHDVLEGTFTKMEALPPVAEAELALMEALGMPSLDFSSDDPDAGET